MTATAVRNIVTELYKLGIGMGEANIFVIADGKTMREIASEAKTTLVFVNNKLWTLSQKGLIKSKSARPATYHLTESGKKAMRGLIEAGIIV
jgi:predicted transcriptional regulator